MMPAKSTSDQRTYSSMTNGCGAVAGEGIPRRGAEAFHPVGLETSPERRATDTEPPRGFRELAARVLQGRGDGLTLSLGECQWTSLWKDRGFTEILRAILQGSEPGAERLQSVADIAAAVLPIDDPPGRRIGVKQATLLIEDDDPLADRIDDRPHERGERGGGVARGADRFVDHWMVILIQILLVQGFIPTNDGVRFVSR